MPCCSRRQKSPLWCLLLVSLRALGRLAGVSASLSLIALSGLPGAGKSTVAAALAQDAAAVVVSVDPIEDAMHRAGLMPTHETGLAAYLVAEVVARESLTLKRSLVNGAQRFELGHLYQPCVLTPI